MLHKICCCVNITPLLLCFYNLCYTTSTVNTLAQSEVLLPSAVLHRARRHHRPGGRCSASVKGCHCEDVVRSMV